MEGREEGREEGIRASRFEIARNLKTMGVATEMIIQATKLTTELESIVVCLIFVCRNS